jgi:ABC-type nitrate/sulfonate/bicarbonate transport system substrate-binding protein
MMLFPLRGAGFTPSKRKSKTVLTISRRALLLSSSVAAVEYAVRGRAGAQASAKIRVAAVPIDITAAVLYAVSQGYFKKRNLDVEVVMMTNGPATAAAVIGGSLEIGTAAVVTIANARDRGIPFVLIAPGAAYSAKQPTGGLIALQNSPLRAPKDLVGKTVGVTSLKGVSEMATRAWLDKNGLPVDAVKFIEIPYAEMPGALGLGRVDAVVAEEPTQTILLSSGARVVANVNDAIGEEWLGGGWFCTADYANAHPDIVRRFADAIAEAGTWANKNHEASAKILESYTKQTINPNQKRAFYPERVSPALLQPLIDVSAKYGLLKASFPAKDVIAPQVLR